MRATSSTVTAGAHLSSSYTPEMANPDAIAAIDVGTNSVHMVIARVAANGRFEVMTREKDMVRLGSGSGEMKELASDAIDRGVAAITRCVTLAESFGAPVRAVATSAVREARNASVFLDRVRAETGVEIDVISGNEEARLIYLGVIQALPVFDSDVVLIDVGGGSTEVLFGRGGGTRYARSIKLGSLRVSNRFFPDGVVRAKSLAKCRKYVGSVVAPLAHETRKLNSDVAVVTSGTAEALALMILTRGAGQIPTKLNAATFSRAALSDLISELAGAGYPEERRNLPGMDPSRADIILGGAVVLEQICLTLALEQLTVSELALREGVLLDTLGRLGLSGSTDLADLRRSSVFHLMELCDDDPDHSIHVARLSLSLFDQLGESLGRRPESRELLEVAALLSNVGMFVAHSAHHKHSYYVIRNTEHLMGFTDSEIELIALIARYHRKSAPTERHPEFAALHSEDQERVRGLAALLRTAIGLDRNHDERVAEVRVEMNETASAKRKSREAVTLILSPTDDRPLDLEIYAAQERSTELSGLLGRAVEVAVSDGS